MNKLYISTWQEVLPKLQPNSVDLIIIDPPFIGVITKSRWDRMEQVDESLVEELYRVAKESCSIYIWCGIGEKSQSLIRWFSLFQKKFHFKDLITWKKNRGIGMRKGWLYTREECMWFVKDNKKFIWNKDAQYSTERRAFDVVKKGGEPVNKSKFKRITNVWTDINELGFGTCPKNFSKSRPKHFTPKPIELFERIIKSHTKEGDLVLDCFAGTGVTGEACKLLNRSYILVEKDKENIEYEV